VLATSLGYFINPLVSVILGVIFLSETLNRRQILAVLLVVIAIANMIWTVGELPWISLTLAISFGLYGLIRKQVEIDSFNGLLFEVLFIFPAALLYLVFLGQEGELSFATVSIGLDMLLLLSGILTILPLVFFAAGVKGINLSTVGFIQYVAPSLSFVLAVYVFNEPFSVEKLISFVLIWTALALISFDAWKRLRANAKR
jgi:chloramphenicol-sensitive protein RarD